MVTYLGELLAVFFFLQLLPGPVDFHVLLVTRDDFCVDLVVALFLHLFFLYATLVLNRISVRADLGDDLRRFAMDLLQETYKGLGMAG